MVSLYASVRCLGAPLLAAAVVVASERTAPPFPTRTTSEGERVDREGHSRARDGAREQVAAPDALRAYRCGHRCWHGGGHEVAVLLVDVPDQMADPELIRDLVGGALGCGVGEDGAYLV